MAVIMGLRLFLISFWGIGTSQILFKDILRPCASGRNSGGSGGSGCSGGGSGMGSSPGAIWRYFVGVPKIRGYLYRGYRDSTGLYRVI